MNGYLEKMGFQPEDRVLITHIDDMGFSHAANQGTTACLKSRAASCASVLVSAPWFQEAVVICQENPEFDVGVHLTLTCEYPTFRWPPLSTRDPASGLLDEQGYMWRTREDGVRHVLAEAAAGEMRAQIDGALEAGIDVTHIDTHMGTVVHPKFIGSYLSLADEYGIPAFLPNMTRERLDGMKQVDMPDEYLEIMDKIDTNAVPTLDEIIIDTLIPLTADMPDKKQFYRDRIAGIKPGLTHLLFHPAVTGEELNAITPESAPSRNADYEAWSDPDLKAFIDSLGIRHIGYRELKSFLG